MSIWCRIGLHKWEFRQKKVLHMKKRLWYDLVECRCSRPACPKFSRWRMVNTEPSRYQHPE